MVRRTPRRRFDLRSRRLRGLVPARTLHPITRLDRAPITDLRPVHPLRPRALAATRLRSTCPDRVGRRAQPFEPAPSAAPPPNLNTQSLQENVEVFSQSIAVRQENELVIGRAVDCDITVRGGIRLLSEVSFLLPPGSLTAVVGPSGSGKSTLLGALTGRRPATAGRVFLGGRDLYASAEGMGRRIGFVPQADAVHESLSVRYALTAAARLRLPADVSGKEIKVNVERVAGELGLVERVDGRIESLSGGQRKRVSVGYELVGEPQALILDEPTSGLDPGLERELMSNLRGLADKGTTTVVVTHSVQGVALCDLVLVLAPGGRLAFIGPPGRVATHFPCPDMTSVFTMLSTRQRAEWEREFAQTTSYRKFGAQLPPSSGVPSAPLPPRRFTRDLRVALRVRAEPLVGVVPGGGGAGRSAPLRGVDPSAPLPRTAVVALGSG